MKLLHSQIVNGYLIDVRQHREGDARKGTLLTKCVVLVYECESAGRYDDDAWCWRKFGPNNSADLTWLFKLIKEAHQWAESQPFGGYDAHWAYRMKRCRKCGQPGHTKGCGGGNMNPWYTPPVLPQPVWGSGFDTKESA